MNRRGTRWNRQVLKVLHLVPLLVVVLVLAGGCRENETGPSSSLTIPFTLGFAPGAQYVYNSWTLDYYGSQSVAMSVHTWRVLAIGTSYRGMNEVTVIADSASTGSDTLYLATAPNSDLFIYGFLARIVKRRWGRVITPEWNLVASFSGGSTGSWIVGSADSAGQETVYGNIAGAADYFAVVVDGVTEVFPTFRVDLTGPTLYYSLWFSNTPNAIVQLLEEPDYDAEGELRELAAIRSGTH
jgi:hypothetical protein